MIAAITNLWEFMSDSPWLSFFLSFPAAIVLLVLTHYAFNTLIHIARAPGYFVRCLSIWKHGRPPASSNADESAS